MRVRPGETRVRGQANQRDGYGEGRQGVGGHVSVLQLYREAVKAAGGVAGETGQALDRGVWVGACAAVDFARLLFGAGFVVVHVV